MSITVTSVYPERIIYKTDEELSTFFKEYLDNLFDSDLIHCNYKIHKTKYLSDLHEIYVDVMTQYNTILQVKYYPRKNSFSLLGLNEQISKHLLCWGDINTVEQSLICMMNRYKVKEWFLLSHNGYSDDIHTLARQLMFSRHSIDISLTKGTAIYYTWFRFNDITINIRLDLTNNNKFSLNYSKYNEKGVRVVEMKDSHLQKIKELEEKVKLLEQTVGQKQIKIDYLEKMIDLASEDYKIDIKKYFLGLALMGAFGNLIPAFLFTKAETHISSSLAGMLNALTPIFTILVALFWLNTKTSSKQISGIIVGFIAAVCLIFSENSFSCFVIF